MIRPLMRNRLRLRRRTRVPFAAAPSGRLLAFVRATHLQRYIALVAPRTNIARASGRRRSTAQRRLSGREQHQEYGDDVSHKAFPIGHLVPQLKRAGTISVGEEVVNPRRKSPDL